MDDPFLAIAKMPPYSGIMSFESSSPSSSNQSDPPPFPEPGIVRRTASYAREEIRKNPQADRAYRTTVGVVGAGTTVLGVMMIPLPGPGGLIALGGLALLGTEFESARKVHRAGVKGAKAAAAKAQEARAKRQEKKRQATEDHSSR